MIILVNLFCILILKIAGITIGINMDKNRTNLGQNRVGKSGDAGWSMV